MSLFYDDLVSRSLLEMSTFLKLKRNTFLGDLLEPTGVTICWLSEKSSFDELINSCVVEKNKQAFLAGNSRLGTRCEICPEDNSLTTPPILQKHRGRSIISLDCTGLQKWDALGFLYRLSLLSKEPTPIVVIDNITAIPRVGQAVEDPVVVENWLLHSWHNDSIQLVEKSGIPFTLHPQDFTVLIPILKEDGSNINLSRLRNDCFGQLEFEESLKRWTETDFCEVYQYYARIGRITRGQETEINEYLKTHPENPSSVR